MINELNFVPGSVNLSTAEAWIFTEQNRSDKNVESVKEDPTQLKSFSEPEIEKVFQKEWEAHIVNVALDNISPMFSGKAIDVFKMAMKNIGFNTIAENFDLKPNTVIQLKNRVKNRLVKKFRLLNLNMSYSKYEYWKQWFWSRIFRFV